MTPDELVRAARHIATHAHAPYSDYHVGAALLCENDQVYLGCNVENASYGLTNCAERTAFFTAVTYGQTKFKALAIAATADPAPFPCGACRQVMAEFCGPDFPVHIANGAGHETHTLGELLPLAFGTGADDA
jgi:cytidine deaminase